MLKISAGGGVGFRLESGGLDFLLDPQRASGPFVLSHAHTDHLPSAVRSPAIASRETIAFAKARTGLAIQSAQVPAQVSLHDAGHMIGSRMAEIRTDSGTVLYTGDFNTRDRLFLSGAKHVKCDVLILDTTYASSSYAFPRMADLTREVRDFVSDSGGRAIFYGYSYGKAQILTRLASDLGLPVLAQAEVYGANVLASSFGHDLGKFSLFGGDGTGRILASKDPAIVVAPGSASHTLLAQKLERAGFASAVFTGWVASGGRRASGPHHVKGEGAFCLSDHSDFQGLLDFVRGCDPREVIIAHAKPESDLPAALKSIGFPSHVCVRGKTFTFV